MAIVAGPTVSRLDNVTTVTVTSDLTPAYYHWYVDGAWVGMTVVGSRSFVLEAGDDVRIEVQDTNDPSYDSIANAPEGWPARRTLYWVRSTDADVLAYLIEQQREAAAFTMIGRVPQLADVWSFSFLTPRLDDLTNYTWRITPVDAAGNSGTPVTIGPEKIVRKPNAPNWTLTWNSGTQFITVSAAA